MQQIVRRLILLISLASTIGIPQKAKATHLAGADISYTCLGGNTYRIDLTFYRDCRGSLAPLGVGIEFRSASCSQYFTDTLLLSQPTGSEITYPCPTLTTACDDPTSPYPGLEEYKYSGIINFPMQCNDWVISWTYTNRNCDITTIVVPLPCQVGTNPPMYIAATLDNLNITCNSSPRFTNVPLAFLCIGQNFTYNHGAIDPDGDSLVYSLVDPMTNATTPVTFQPGYSALNPIMSTPPLMINSVNGDLNMTPTQQEVGILSVLVQEYRNGVLIGSVVRDMEIYVNPCTNNLPTASGMNGTNDRDTTVCPGTQICFDVLSNDIDTGQIVTMTWNQGISNATFTVSGFPYPTGQFCWTPTSADISANPHSFIVNVVDNACPNGGSQSYSFDILVNSPLVNITSSNISCNGLTDGSATIAPVVPGTPMSFVWQHNGSTSPTQNNLSAGTYTVNAFDSLTGCAGSFTVTITDPPALTDSIVVSNAPCAGTNSGIAIAVAVGGTPPYSYSWNTAPPTLNDTASGLPAGTYTVVITDDRGCTTTDSVSINPSSAPVIAGIDSTASVLSVTCFGDTTGIAVATASGGTPGYTFSWNTVPPIMNDTATGLTGGTYIVTITDSAGCTATQSVTIASPPQIAITPVTTLPTCLLADGSITVNVAGGTGGFTYMWDTLGNTTNTLSNIPAGIYTVTVTDSSNCTETLTIPLSNNNIPPPLAFSYQNVSCNGGNDGIAVVQPQGGTPPFTYSWNTVPPQNTDTAFNLSAGVYIAGITDSGGCIAFDTVTVSEPAPIFVSVTTNATSCNGDSTGSATASVLSGGTAPFTYSWSPLGGTSDNATGLPPGTYTVTVTDANLCTGTGSVTIPQTSAVNASINQVTQPSCFGASDGSVDIDVTGAGGFTYFWNPGGATTQDLNNIDAGIYIVTVTDVNGCTQQLQVNVNQPSPVPANAGADTAICAGNSIQLNATLASGTSGAWTSSTGITFSNNTDPNATASNIAPGINNITWTVTDANGCTGSDIISIFNYLNLSTDAGSDTAFCGLASIQLNAQILPGFTGNWAGPSGVSFDDPSLQNAIATLADYGIDTLTWSISNNACVASDYIVVGAYQPVVADAGVYQVVCTSKAVLIALPLNSGSGFWSVQTPGQATIADANNDTTDVTDFPQGNTIFIWQVSDGPCSGSDTVSIDYDPACELELPTGFSPNGDGFNDGYFIRGIDGYPHNIFRVFNRWGNEVYVKDDYVNSDWVGVNKNGDDLPEGTYFVVLEIKNSDLRKSTYVDLRRFIGK